jgi:N-acetylmuramoyl-L-alanine amidase
VSTTDWSYPYIRDLYCRGIVTGYLDRTFHPNDATSRLQFLAMEGRTNGWAWITPTPATFRDVPPASWGYGYVEYAVRRGLITGYADGTFRPSAPVTRAQVAKLITLAAGWPTTPPANPPTFSDVPPTHWAYAYIGQLVAHGFAGGYADHTFHPETSITRAQISKILDLWILNGSR